MRALVVTCLFVLAARAEAGPATVAILELAGEPSTASLRSTIVDRLASEISRRPNLKAITKNDIQALLGLERMKDALGCGDVSCLAEIGGALGADRLMSGTLSASQQHGADFFSLTIQLIDPKMTT